MKTCPICQRDYAEHMRYCTRDGTKLQTENLLNSCPECLLSFPENITRCPEHNLELIAQAKVIEPISFCTLCNQYYPPTNINCPIHGIALKVNNLQSSSKPSDSPKLLSSLSSLSNSKENLSPVVATILEEIIRTDNLSAQSAKLNQVSELDENLPVSSPSIETNQVANQEVMKAADTKNLTAPAVLPFDTLGQYAVDQVSADRKFLIAIALIVVCSVAGFAAYSFPYAVQWPKVSADTQPKTSSLPNSSDNQPALLEPNASIPVEKPVEKPVAIETATSSEEKDIVQQIQYPQVKPSLANVTDKQNKLKGEPKSSQVKPKLETASNKVSSKSNVQTKIDNKSATKLSTKETKPNSNSKPTVDIAKVKTSNSKESQTTNNRKSDKGTEISKNSETNQQRKVSPKVTEPTLSRSQPWDSPALGQMKSPRRVSAKVTASVVNKSRLQTPNGYVYQFDLVVKELNGVKVKWNYTSARKSTYSGDNSIVSGLLGEELDANGSVQFRMAVRMTGRCIEDWYGQIIYNCSGIDENGNSVELHQVLALDNNFPTY